MTGKISLSAVTKISSITCMTPQQSASMKLYLRKTANEIFRYSPLIEYEKKLAMNGSLASLFFKGLKLEDHHETAEAVEEAKQTLWFEHKCRIGLRNYLKSRKNNVAGGIKRRMEGEFGVRSGLIWSYWLLQLLKLCSIVLQR